MRLLKVNVLKENMSKKKSCLILLSGGVDSSACTCYYQKLGYRVSGIFIDYGQAGAKFEKQSAERIAENYHIPLFEYLYKNNKTYLEGEIPGRNAFLLVSTVMSNPNYEGLLAIGIHSGTSYYALLILVRSIFLIYWCYIMSYLPVYHIDHIYVLFHSDLHR